MSGEVVFCFGDFGCLFDLGVELGDLDCVLVGFSVGLLECV